MSEYEFDLIRFRVTLRYLERTRVAAVGTVQILADRKFKRPSRIAFFVERALW